METVNHECYVSLEVAKLLKEAGFNWEVNHRWQNWSNYADTTPFFLNALDYYEDSNEDVSDDAFSAPTLDVAQRWLREVKKMRISVFPVENRFTFIVVWLGEKFNQDDYILEYNTYEEAQEEGIKKALEIILEKGE